MIDLNTLNAPQREAVLTTEGPLLILAGAGSGKTRVLTYRVAYLMEQKRVPAWRILAITFTNKAAKEMKSRIESLVGADEAEEAWISTFHSCCARILRRDIEKLEGYDRRFSIYDSDDTQSLVKATIKALGLDEKKYPVRAMRAMISDAKNRMVLPDQWLESELSDGDREKARVYAAYERALRENNALDFDDLLVKTLILFMEHPPVLQYYRDRFDYVMVDEYQDTNAAQYELVHLLTEQKRNLCVVGDDDQSIYGWRGADIRNILDFEKDFPDVKIIKLEQNYRSTGNILDAANQVIAHNRGRREKTLWTAAPEGDLIGLWEALDERDEASFVARTAKKYIAQGVQPGRIAVLYRANVQSRIIEEMFVREQIPYRVYGAQRFYERKEVKDIVAYMRVLVNPEDDLSLRRIINEPKRSIGPTSVDALADYAASEALPLMQAAMSVEEATGLTTRAKAKIAEFGELMLELTEALYEKRPAEFTELLLEKTGYIAALEAANTDEARERIENVKELAGAVTAYEEQHPEGSIAEFLENVALIADSDNINETGGAVTLTTLHSAKGLEFDTVLIPGMEETVFPTTRAQFDEKLMEEERRLAYVGITRAEKHLILCYARSRALYNQRTGNSISRFIEEIPERLLKRAGRRVGERVPPPSAARSGYGYQSGRGGYPSGYSSGYSGARPSVATPPTYTPSEVKRGGPTYVPSSASKGAVITYAVGDCVYHRTFGKGHVVSAYGTGAQQRIEIEFERNGKRSTFDSALAPLVRVKE